MEHLICREMMVIRQVSVVDTFQEMGVRFEYALRAASFWDMTPLHWVRGPRRL
jgi:hypothetical protein